MADTLQYINYDFAAQKAALQQRIQARYPGLWNSFFAGDLGTVIIDVVAWGFTTLAFLVNRMAGEQFIPTMTKRESASRIGALVGYKLHGTTAAVVSCEVTLPQAQSVDITIAKGTQIRTSDNSSTVFEVAKNYVISAGSLTPSTPVVNISPLVSGQNVIASTLNATNGSATLVLADTTVDLTQFVENGLTFIPVGFSTEYTVTGATGNTLTVSPVWSDATSTGVTGPITDRRIQLVQGKTVAETFTVPSGLTSAYSVAINSSGTQPVIDNSVSVTVNGNAWTPVSSLLLSQTDSTNFQVDTTALGVVRVTFGDGTFGEAIPGNASVVITYRIGGGTAGNIALSTINTTIPILIAQTNSPVALAITNSTSAGIGGQNPETLEEARVNIPQFTQTNSRCVTLQDYQSMAMGFYSPLYGSVVYSRATLGIPGYLTGPMVVVYGWTTGTSGGLVNLSSALKQSLQDYLQGLAVGTDYVQVYDGTTVPAPIAVRFKALSGYSVSDVSQTITAAINSKITSLYPGDPVIYSDLVATLDTSVGVASLTVATPTSDLIPADSTQLFTVPDDSYVYALDRVSSGQPVNTTVNGRSYALSQYTVQLPVYPVQPWALNMTLGGQQLIVLPGLVPGYADVYGSQLSPLQAYRSQINLITGQMTVWINGAAGDLSLSLNHVVGYTNDRKVDVYISAPGIATQSQRRSIRSVLRQWSNGFQVGAPLYGTSVPGVLPSLSNISDVVTTYLGTSGAVSRVSLQTANNAAAYVMANPGDLFTFGNLYINNAAD